MGFAKIEGRSEVQFEFEPGGIFRRDICHKHHKQRLCKIISTWVKFYFVNVLFKQFMCESFLFNQVILIIKTNDKVFSEPASTKL